MDFFTKLGETLSEAGRDVSKKAKDLTENTKMDMDIRAKESYINKQYTAMGKKYFELHENDEEPLFEEITLIREAKEEIRRMKDLLAEKKGLKKCQACQAIIAQDAQFCPKCGTKYEAPAPQEAAAEAGPEEPYAAEAQIKDAAQEAAEPKESAAGEVQAEEVPAGEVQTEEMPAKEAQTEEAPGGDI